MFGGGRSMGSEEEGRRGYVLVPQDKNQEEKVLKPQRTMYGIQTI